MAARERILAEIRRRQGRGGPLSPAERERIDTYLRRHPRGPLRELPADPIARFRERAEASASTTDSVRTLAEAPAAVARYLEAQRLSRTGCMWPQVAALDWRGASLALESRAANGDDAIGVTSVFSAIAETGTLMMCSGPDTPATVSLLPETHIALVPIERIVPFMEDAWDLLRAEFGQLPRAVNFISGPSRTADIEQTLVLGAHGPYRVHIVLVGLQPRAGGG
jgi:L-lactate dehydrogenase complex protein LldG